MEVAVLLFALLLFLLAVLIVARIIRGAIHFSSTKKCPHCAERVKIAATACKHCGRDLEMSA